MSGYDYRAGIRAQRAANSVTSSVHIEPRFDA
jgi:hypothetical protein